MDRSDADRSARRPRPVQEAATSDAGRARLLAGVLATSFVTAVPAGAIAMAAAAL